MSKIFKIIEFLQEIFSILNYEHTGKPDDGKKQVLVAAVSTCWAQKMAQKPLTMTPLTIV